MTAVASASAQARRADLRIGVLALQGDVEAHCDVLADLGAIPVPVRKPADAHDLAGLVLPGGESTTMSLLLESSGLTPLIAKQLAAGLPVLGTCAGMILLSKEILDGRRDQICFGAIDLVVRRNAFGRQVESFETDLNVKGFDGPMHAVFIRAPYVESAGPAVDILASVDAAGTGAERPVVCTQGNVIVAAFHPELAGDGRLHEMLIGLIGSEGD